MSERPYVLLSCAVSLDGYLDDATEVRLVLSDAADLDRVDGVRAGYDAILVGAGTVRSDNPRLLVRDAARRRERVRRGLSASPTKVTVTERAKLDPDCRFFTTGDDVEKIVYCAGDTAWGAGELLAPRATVVDGGRKLTMRQVARDLHRRGVRRLMVEGGASVLGQFLRAGLADELQLVVAPVLVADPRAVRLTDGGWTSQRLGRLDEVRQIGDVALLRYALSRAYRPEHPS